MRALAIGGFVLKSADPRALADFFVRALSFSPEDREGGPARLRIGSTRLDIEHGAGRPYPKDAPGCSTLFQHFAIATADMRASFGRLCETGGWTAISRDGPVTLPASSGGVTAFKFRDPEGHPLELIEFPRDGGRPRIDHSAISVAEAARSIAWYEPLGFRIASRSLNQGPEQAALDALADPVVDVIGLALERPAPHLELLAYRVPPCRPDPPPGLNDIAATRVVLACADPPSSRSPCQDPDGHWIEWESRPSAR